MIQKKIETDGLNNPATNPILKDFALKLFLKFYESAPTCYRFNSKVIPLSFVNFFFSWFRIGRKQKFEILKIWEAEGLCELRRFHGIRILKIPNSDKNLERDRLYFQLRGEVKKLLEGEQKDG